MRRLSGVALLAITMVITAGTAEAGDAASLSIVSVSTSTPQPGGRVEFSATVQNVGTTIWSPIGTTFSPTPSSSGGLVYPEQTGYYYLQLEFFHLDAADPFDPYSSLQSLVPMPGVLEPGESTTVTSHFFAPQTPGRWGFTIQMAANYVHAFEEQILHSPADSWYSSPRFEFVVGDDTPPAGAPWRITEWTEATPVPESAYFTGAVAHGNHIFFLHSTGRVFSGEVRPDGSIAGWTETLSAPHSEETIKGAVVVGDFLVVPSKPTSMIGVIGSGGTIESWSEGPPVNSPATNGRVSVAHGSWIYTMGGSYPYWQMVDLVEVAFLSPDGALSAWQQVSTLPVGAGLQDPIPIVVGDDLVVFGGETGNGDTTNSSNIFRAPIGEDGTLGSWAFVGRTVMPRPHSAYLRYGETIHAVGGGVHSYMTDHVESSLLTEFGRPDRAIVSAPLPTVRNGLNAVTVGRFGFVLGGHTCAYGGCNPTSVWMARLAADSMPPVLFLPESLTVEAAGPAGAEVSFVATAQDDADGDVAVSCDPASGSLFPVGTTAVTCSAVDTHGNAATGSFPITVRPFGPPPVTVVLVDSTGVGIAGAVVSYYQGSWQPFGVTGAEGSASLDLPAGSYAFRVELGGGAVQKAQHTGTNHVVSFQTVNVLVRLRDSLGSALDTGTADYYAGSWRTFGVTNGGEVRREMLPTSYSFAMTYLGGRVQVTQNVSANPVVTFQTREVVVGLRNSTNLPLDGGVVEYYAGSWRPFGTTSAGETRKELLPTSYSFAMKWAGGRVQLTQNVASSPSVAFQTGAVLSDSGSCTSYYASSWKPFTQGIELLPGTYPFSFSSGAPTQQSFAIAASAVNHIR